MNHSASRLWSSIRVFSWQGLVNSRSSRQQRSSSVVTYGVRGKFRGLRNERYTPTGQKRYIFRDWDSRWRFLKLDHREELFCMRCCCGCCILLPLLVLMRICIVTYPTNHEARKNYPLSQLPPFQNRGSQALDPVCPEYLHALSPGCRMQLGHSR